MSLINKEALILPLLFAIIAPSQSLDNSFSIRSLVRISGQHVKGVSSISIVMLIFKDVGPRWQTCICLVPQKDTRSGGFLEKRGCFCKSINDGPKWRPRGVRGGMLGGRWFGQDIANWFKKKWDECQSYFCQTIKH